jgi:hypothetical protein
MSALISMGFKQPDGSYKNYTIAINDKTDKFGRNVSMYEEQSKEQRNAKEPKKYIGNGKVFWTDGKIEKAVKPEDTSPSGGVIPDDTNPLPF